MAAIVFFLGSTCWAQSKASFSSYYDGKRYEFEITEKMLDQTAVWSESAEAPRHAAQIAQQNLSVFVPNGAKWSLHNIRLSPVGNAWVYLVEFLEPLPEDGTGLTSITGTVSTFRVVVLMNGEVVKPRITERKLP